jgi:hypothetical protein
VNIFEGARRISYLVAGLAIAGTLIYSAKDDPYILNDYSFNYSIAQPRASFIRMDEDCPTEAAQYQFTKMILSGQEAAINLCLLTMPFGSNNEQLVPYKIDEKGVMLGATPNSHEVSTYKRELEERFALPAEDSKSLKNVISHHYWENWKKELKNLAFGLVIFAGFVWAVGWILRGFMGIPYGMDKKPNGEV